MTESQRNTDCKHPYGNIEGIATLTNDTLVRYSSVTTNKIDKVSANKKGRK